jgi:polyhydroxyalkanoate synthesis repressor PhaR
MKLIKKYQNRRLYDVNEKKYITLNILHKMICEGQELQVKDFKDSRDITKEVLVQIILEKDLLKLENFSNEKLVNLISILSGDKKESYNNFLQESTDHFISIDDIKKNPHNNEERLSTNKLTKFWQSLTGAKNE